MSSQKFRRISTSTHSGEHYQTTKQNDQQKISDLEFLLNKAAEEITRYKEINENLELQIAQHKVDNFSNVDNTELQNELIRLTKQNKKLKQKCKCADDLIKENENLKRDIKDLLIVKIENKENKQPNKQVSHINLKALEEAEKFLLESKQCNSSRQPKEFQPSAPVVKQSSQWQFEADLNQALQNQADFSNEIRNIYINAAQSLNKRLSSDNQLITMAESMNDAYEYVTCLKEQLWVEQQKNQIIKDQFVAFSKSNNNSILITKQQLNQEDILIQQVVETPQYDHVKEMENVTNLMLQVQEKYVKTVQNLKDQLKNTQQEHLQTLQENEELLRQLKHYTNQQADYDVLLQEILEIREQNNCITSEFEQLAIELNQEVQKSLDSTLWQIHSLFEQPKRTQTISLDYIIENIEQLQQDNYILKQKYVDLLYISVVTAIRNQPNTIEREIGSRGKLQEALTWLLENPKSTIPSYQLFEYSDQLQQIIDYNGVEQCKSNDFKDIFNMQMKIVYSLFKAVSSDEQVSLKSNNSVSSTGSRSALSAAYVNEALKELKTLNNHLNTLPDQTSARSPMTDKVLTLCRRIQE